MAPQAPGALRRPPPPPPRNEHRPSPYKTSRPGRSESDSANEVKKPAAPAVISAEPQIRNLQKELTKLVPAAVLRKKATGGVSSPAIPKVSLPKINAAPDMDYNVDTSVRPTTNLSNLTASIFGKMGPVKPPNPAPSNASVSSSASKPQKSSTNDEYEDFMKEMEGLL
ncbi:hypothetical protein K7432_010256 [Basidiobolus ranarum]|uniref:Uncharacterized protein n=1 Tax=Basidiobolus ranarum TaxID=34480 RepID=A0ABR2WNZ7_9FUNG